MSLPRDYVPEFDSFKQILLELAHERSAEGALDLLVRRMVELRPHVALARIWLLRPGDICDRCPMRQDCPDQNLCLHLVASAGRPITHTDEDWSRLDGDFCRFPLGVHKIGRVGLDGKDFHIPHVQEDRQWVARPEWAKREDIQSFSTQPLLYKQQVIGVLGVFLRLQHAPEHTEGRIWLRMLADHAAVAIANAKAFEEIERLRKQLEMENAYLREEVQEAHDYGDIVGQSPALRNLIQQIELVAPTDANVLILGESGTGKELVAREIHNRSRRRDHPMIKVNCASIPSELYESEFFGHVKGAFTGAVKDRAGRFELADDGTIFLDEVGEIPLQLQSKLLRVLQEGTYERIGDDRTRQVDVRVIAASNRDLRAEVDAGRFRQDLFYRLNVFPAQVAPLRERKEDIPVLADHFLKLAARKFHRPVPRPTPADIMRLQRYDWPGNVRELQNVCERAVITTQAGRLSFDLPDQAAQPAQLPLPNTSVRSSTSETELRVRTDEEMRQIERDNIIAALDQTGWKVYGQDGAAEALGIRPTTLASRMKKMGIRRQKG